MKRLLLFLAILALAAVPAEASILSNLLDFDGLTDIINDTSVAEIYNNDADDVFSKGDHIVGIMRLDNVDGASTDNRLYAIFALEVTGSRTVGSFTILEHGAINPADLSGHSIKELLDDTLEPTLSSGTWADVMFAILEVPSFTADGVMDPFASGLRDAADDPLTVITSTFTAAKGYTLDILGGQVASQDFFDAKFVGDITLDQISEIKADNTGTQVLTDRAGFTVQYHNMGASVVFVPVGLAKFGGMTTYYHDIILAPDGNIGTSDSKVDGGFDNWDMEDHSDFKVNATPEPASLAVWSVLAGLGLVGGMRRRKRRSA